MQSPKTFPIQQEETTQEKVTGREEEGSPIAVDIDKRRPLPSPNVGRPLPYPEESKPAPPSTTTQQKKPLPLHEMIPLPTISTSENLPSPSTLAIYTEIPEMPEGCVHSYSNVPRTLDGYLKPQCEQCGIRQAKGEETATNTKI